MVKSLEDRVKELENVVLKLPRCKNCGYLLMLDEHRTDGVGTHLQCINLDCASFWDLKEPKKDKYCFGP